MGAFSFLFGRAIDKRIAAYQNELITKHCDEVQNIYKMMRGWRHDYHNHIQVMKALTAQMRETGEGGGTLEQLEEYLDKLNADLTTVDTVVKTGNVMVDAILNSKLSLIKAKNLPVNVKAAVPETFSVSEVDLCAVIGNLLDNAMEACEKQPEDTGRFIRVYIGVLKQQLYVSVSNSAYGEVRKDGKRYLSTKRSANHGYGLLRIDRIIDKYHGYVNRQNEEGVFVTEVMLPL
ncbi:MAG: GHKL domain-containing protein [Roseburia sp.]|nr:GHKL domain-containing protein [Roseburia sp.]MCM1242774.1 GHKL domain-containing protein [Roseburia sp.]